MNFSKIRREIRKSRCTTGINDTGGKFATGVNDTGVNDTGGKIAAGINDTGGKFATVVSDSGGKFIVPSFQIVHYAAHCLQLHVPKKATDRALCAVGN